MALSHLDLRRELIDTARRLTDLGILSGMEGNLSARVPGQETFLISEAGVKSTQLTPEKLVLVDYQGNVLEGSGKPSSGVPMHAMVYRLRPDAMAVVHTHSPYATGFAIANEPIPCALEALRDIVGGGVPIAAYAPLGTQELARNVAAAMTRAWAVLLGNHGVLAFGRDLRHAATVAYMVEAAAKMTVIAKLIGRIELLPREEGPPELGATSR